MGQAKQRLLVVGGGAAGYFGAIAAAEVAGRGCVVLAEAAAQPLAKVRISGGGRCNATHACLDPRELVKRYPRGGRELLGPFHRFGPRETIAWFAEHGVRLKTEADGRMFPVTDSSSTIIEALQDSARRAGVEVRLKCPLKELMRTAGGAFEAVFGSGEREVFGKVLLATGGNRGSAGMVHAAAFGHTIVPCVPSLFTFNIPDCRLKGLEGVSVAEAGAAVPAHGLHERGPVLVTHWGLSGPAILRLSAWGARELAAAGYKFEVVVSWNGRTPEQSAGDLRAFRAQNVRRLVSGANPWGLPSRLWERLSEAPGGPGPRATWSGVSNQQLQALAAGVSACVLRVEGKSTNKDEFVTCGGVSLREVDFRTLESRIVPGLHFAGEILDIDGITGGFNFQAAWTTSWHAGRAMAGAPV